MVDLKLWEVSGVRATTVVEGLLNLAYGLESLHLKGQGQIESLILRGPYTHIQALEEVRVEAR